jgi:hypothetical protein
MNQTKAPITILDVDTFMNNGGWRRYVQAGSRADRSYYKRFATPTPCRCNADKPGIQVTAHAYCREGQVNVEMSLSGELADGSWINVNRYGIPGGVPDALAAVPEMLRVWEAAAAEKGDQEEQPVKPHDQRKGIRWPKTTTT